MNEAQTRVSLHLQPDDHTMHKAKHFNTGVCPLTWGLILLLAALVSPSPSRAAAPENRCGEAVIVKTHDSTTTRYAFLPSTKTSAAEHPITLVLLPGGSGHLDLDETGCPRALKGNSLVRSIPLFAAAGFGTALVDAPSDYHGEDGLGGFRITTQHAEDLGKIIADLRTRTPGAVWLIGTSRGTISAVNAATRLSGAFAPDGVVLTSALTLGDSMAKKKWVAHTVFDLPLQELRLPLLVVGHAADKCSRSPADLMNKVVERTRSLREQVVTVTGGPGQAGAASVIACEGRTPHGFIDQEGEVAAGIERFIRGGDY